MRVRAVLAATAALAALPAGADAATVALSTSGPPACSKYGCTEIQAQLSVIDRDEAADTLAITVDLDGVVTVRDATADLTPQAGCRAVDARTVACGQSLGTSPLYLTGTVDAGGGDDVVTVPRGFDRRIDVRGGPGADRLAGAVVDGGPGADVLDGDAVSYADRTAGVRATADGVADDGEPGEGDDVRPAVDRVVGGRGDDVLAAGASGATLDGAGGHDTLDGGPARDVLLGGAGDDRLSGSGGDDHLGGGDGQDSVGGGAGTDVASYGGARERVHADLDGVRDDGRRGERDRIGTDVESLIGGERDDVLVGDGRANRLEGGRGSDVLRGGAGDDRLVGTRRVFTDADRLLAGPGSDTVYAGPRDAIDVRDGRRDEVDCTRVGRGHSATLTGDGRDRVRGCAPAVQVGGPQRVQITRAWTAPVRLRCPASTAAPGCVGTLSIDFPRLLGRRGFRIAPGAAATVAVPLTASARALLRKERRYAAFARPRTRRTHPASGFVSRSRDLLFIAPPPR